MLFIHRSKYRLLLIVLVVLSFSGSAFAETEQKPAELKFNAQGKFKIVQFSDVHWKEDSTEVNKHVHKLMAQILDEERPDLVVFAGDIIRAEPARQGLTSVFKPVVERKIPWAAVLGNHDDENGMTREEIIDLLEKMPHSLVQRGPKDIGGCGNYVLTVKASSGENDAAAIYLLDSLGYPQRDDVGKYDWFRFAQIKWYREQSASLTQAAGGRPLPSLMFFHIPLPEYKEIGHVEGAKYIGSNLEPIGSSCINSGMFAAILESGDVMGTFVGHDHDDDYAGCLYGVCLAFGRVTGFDAYGKLPRGARVIELSEGRREFNSWIRCESGGPVEKFHYPTAFEEKKEK